MILIALKLLLAMVLSTVPFLIPYAIKKDSSDPNSDGTQKGLPGLVKRCFPKLVGFLHRVVTRMSKSKNARKLYIILLIIVLLIFTYVDFRASEEALKAITMLFGDGSPITDSTVINIDKNSFDKLSANDKLRAVALNPVISNGYAILLSQVFTFVLFSYRLSNCILLWLNRNWNFMACFNFMLIATVALYAENFFIIAEVMNIYLLAAMYYPYMLADPQGGKFYPLDVNKTTQVSKIAA